MKPREVARERALALWEEGQSHHRRGDVDGAIALYSRSIEVFPTAEAHTFRGWAYSWQGRIDDAISECKRAIEVDPTLGNPYNDIGCYLFQQGKHDDAIPWLEQAKRAERYEPRHFPFMNLGRIYAARGEVLRAIQEFEAALALCPGERVCETALARLRALN